MRKNHFYVQTPSTGPGSAPPSHSRQPSVAGRAGSKESEFDPLLLIFWLANWTVAFPLLC